MTQPTYLRIRAMLAKVKQRPKRKRYPPITVDPNKTLDLPRYDSDPIWNEIEARSER